MGRIWKVACGGLTAVLLLAGCGGSTRSPSSTTRAGSPPHCTSAQLGTTIGQPEAGLGHVGAVIMFRDTSATACVLSGYPGVAGLDSLGHQVVQAARTPGGYLGGLQPSRGGPLPAVDLAARGGTASAYVEGTDHPVGPATSCATYTALLVTPPNALQPIRLATQLPACTRLEIHPVVPGLTGRDNR
ncbi:MAG TPA: DUF4232 domain-containing protein [Acidimicrobiales bacterium]|nr:DUF4232 domain-containing protein [Acidimicrobiales bacterium]